MRIRTIHRSQSLFVAQSISSVRQAIARARDEGRRCVGFVPTMGALHAGHMSLVELARQQVDVVVVSVFVNPNQFGPDEDYACYPRPLDQDVERCRSAGVDMVFTPTVEEMYGDGSLTEVRVNRLTAHLCGRSRPGHFDGVSLVCAKLFHIIQPDRAYFGQKDAQQVAVIKRMVRDLNMQLEIVVCPIVREADGLAMSSRNNYLNTVQRRQAAVLYRSLLHIREQVVEGQRQVCKILQRARNTIESAGPCKIDYLEIVDTATMYPLEIVDRPVLAALAVWIGQCRLIDNLLIDVVDDNG